MFFTTVVATLFAGVALALPTVEERQAYVPCSGLYSNTQCCATDVLGVADLDCGEVPTIPTSGDDFSAICAEMGQRARCCVLPIVSDLQPTRIIGRAVANTSSSWSKAFFATPLPVFSTPSRSKPISVFGIQRVWELYD